MMALCLLDVAAFGFGDLASALLKADKMVNTAKVMKTSANLISNVASFGMNARAGMDTAFGMYDKYVIQGQSVDSNTKWEALQLGMSIFGCVISGRGMAKETKQLGTMLSNKGFTGVMKNELLGFAQGVKKSFSDFMADNRGFADFSAPIGGGKGGTGSDNYVYRALNQKDLERYTNGLGLEAKNPNGSWSLKEHLVNGSGKTSWANDPYISTTSDLSVAEGFNQSGSGYGIVKIDMNKVTSASYKGYEIYPRVNGVEGLPYHYSVWQQEISVYQNIPFDAIVDYFK